MNRQLVFELLLVALAAAIFFAALVAQGGL